MCRRRDSESRRGHRFGYRVLARAGIETVEQLRRMGAVQAYLAVRRTGVNPGLNLLWALHGALVDRDAHELSNKARLALMKELQSIDGTSYATIQK